MILNWALYNFIKVALQGQENRNSSKGSVYTRRAARHWGLLYMYMFFSDKWMKTKLNANTFYICNQTLVVFSKANDTITVDHRVGDMKNMSNYKYCADCFIMIQTQPFLPGGPEPYVENRVRTKSNLKDYNNRVLRIILIIWK